MGITELGINQLNSYGMDFCGYLEIYGRLNYDGRMM